MAPATTPSGRQTHPALPPLPQREELTAHLAAVVDAIVAEPKMQPPNRHPTLYHLWDFAMRAKYILSELDNIAEGKAVQYPVQIPDLPKESIGKPDPGTAQELMADVLGRCVMIQTMIRSTNRSIMTMMGLEDVEFGEEVKAKADELLRFTQTMMGKKPA